MCDDHLQCGHDGQVEAITIAPPGWDLPGRGEPGSGCGSPVGKICDCCGWYFEVEKECNMKTCPHCWRRWAFLSGKRAGLRAWAGWKMVMGSRRRGSRLIHVVVSLKYEGGELDAYKRRTFEICKEHGIIGGASICHHARERGEGGRIPDGYVHYHIIGIAPGNITPGQDQGELFHVIRNEHNGYRGFGRTSEVIRCLQYLLTHAAVKPGKHTLTWFGALSYNKLSNGALKEFAPGLFEYMENVGKTRCPSCGSTEISSAWDIDSLLDQRARNEAQYRIQPALALERYGIVIT